MIVATGAQGERTCTVPRVELRDATSEDLPLYTRLLCDPQTMAHLGGPLTREKAEDTLRRELDPAFRERTWARVIVTDAGEDAGSLVLWTHEEGAPLDEIGWMVLPAFQGRGWEAGRPRVARRGLGRRPMGRDPRLPRRRERRLERHRRFARIHARGGARLHLSRPRAPLQRVEAGPARGADPVTDMDDRLDAYALLVCGAYGTGKTSLVEEMADLLEGRGVRYAAIDLDWLGWFDTGQPDHDAGWPVLLRNLDAVVANYHGEGVRRFLIAGTIGGPRRSPTNSARRSGCRSRRCGSRCRSTRSGVARVGGHHGPRARPRGRTGAGRTGREDDVGDLVVENDRPITETASSVLAWFDGRAR